MVSDSRPLGDDGAAALLRDFAISAEVARRFRGGTELTLLRSVSDAAVVLFGAEACSIAVYDAAENMLEYRVASGPHGTEVVGVRVSPSQGIAGYVFSTGQPLAITDVASDPRFDRSTAEHTGYVPRSIAAVPLIDDETALGVLQVLDKRGDEPFSLRDLELLAVFGSQAAQAIRTTQLQRDLRRVLADVAEGFTTASVDERAALIEQAIQQQVDRATSFWALVDVVARLRALPERELTLVTALLEAAARHAGRPRFSVDRS
ncbi:MAG TPA: GAF domain-containing protein [Candidatus Limnocylindrales bacterium]